jgi:hypothetical protein
VYLVLVNLLEIPQDNYTLETFLEYIVRNMDTVFRIGKQPRWLKAHLVYTYREWKRIFEDLEIRTYGEIIRITFQNFNDIIHYYAYEWAPGLLMLFTSSTEEDYEKTLKILISQRRGIIQSWIRPSLFEEMKNTLVSDYDAKIYRFISKRYKHWKTAAQIRPETNRRLSYSAEDADEVLKESRSLYGTIPTSIDMRVGDSKIQINRDGLFVIRQINLRTIGILRHIVGRIVEEQVRIRNTSERFNIEMKKVSIGDKEYKISKIVAGKILLPNTRLSEAMIKRMFHQYEDFYQVSEPAEDEEFSFIDTFIQEDPLTFTATVIDEINGTVFGVSGVDKEIALIPKHRTSFESFIKFYNSVQSNFDDSAELTTFSEPIVAT